MKGEGMLTNSVIATIGAAIAIFIGILVISQILSSSSLPMSGTSVVNESIAFTSTTLPIIFANQPSCLSAHPLQSDCGVQSISRVGNTSYTVNTTCYKFNATYINLTLNGGVDCKNNTAGSFDVSYVYNNFANAQAASAFASVQTTNWNAIQLLSVGLIVMAAVVILSYFTFGRKK